MGPHSNSVRPRYPHVCGERDLDIVGQLTAPSSLVAPFEIKTNGRHGRHGRRGRRGRCKRRRVPRERAARTCREYTRSHSSRAAVAQRSHSGRGWGEIQLEELVVTP